MHAPSVEGEAAKGSSCNQPPRRETQLASTTGVPLLACAARHLSGREASRGVVAPQMDFPARDHILLAMKALLQRVSQASVQVGDETIAAIGPGLVVLLGVARDDTERQARRLAERTLAARLFPSESHPMDRSVLDVGGEVLAVSQFTLAADTKKGNRPGFGTAARAEVAEPLYDLYCGALASGGGRVQTGRFGADMQVSLVNDGPVTVILEA